MFIRYLHSEVHVPEVILQQEEQITANTQAVQLGDEAVMLHPVKCSCYVKSNDEYVLSLV